MVEQDSEDVVFYVTKSKKRTWVYAIFCWTLALFLLRAMWSINLLTKYVPDDINGVQNYLPVWYLIIAILIPPTLIFIVGPFAYLKRWDEPLATIDRDGITGMGKWYRPKSLDWQPNTKITYIMAGHFTIGIKLSNPGVNQDKWFASFRRSPNRIMLETLGAKESLWDVEGAIRRFNPYNQAGVPFK